MEYKVIRTTDGKFVGTRIRGDTLLEILEKVRSLCKMASVLEYTDGAELIVSMGHTLVVLKKL
jgi:hypothetical protein